MSGVLMKLSSLSVASCAWRSAQRVDGYSVNRQLVQPTRDWRPRFNRVQPASLLRERPITRTSELDVRHEARILWFLQQVAQFAAHTPAPLSTLRHSDRVLRGILRYNRLILAILARSQGRSRY